MYTFTADSLLRKNQDLFIKDHLYSQPDSILGFRAMNFIHKAIMQMQVVKVKWSRGCISHHTQRAIVRNVANMSHNEEYGSYICKFCMGVASLAKWSVGLASVGETYSGK